VSEKKFKDFLDEEYTTAVKQVSRLAMPNRYYDYEAPMPWLSFGLACSKVSIQKGTQIGWDITQAQNTLKDSKLWANIYYYTDVMYPDLLQHWCKLGSNNDVQCMWMHPQAKDMSKEELSIVGEFPLIMVYKKSFRAKHV